MSYLQEECPSKLNRIISGANLIDTIVHIPAWLPTYLPTVNADLASAAATDQRDLRFC